MRLLTRIWFWLLAIPLLVVGSITVSFGLFAALDRLLGSTAMSVWGDMEGLIVPVRVGAAALFVLGFVILIRYLLRASRPPRSS